MINEPKWISVTDRLPEAKEGWDHSKRCLVCYDGDNYGIAFYHHRFPEEGGRWVDFHHYGSKPTHWIPLPEPPKIENL